MKAIVQDRFGPPDVLRLADTGLPAGRGRRRAGPGARRRAQPGRLAHVIDYTREDFTDGRAHYDVILDNVSSLPLTRLRGALTPKGTLVLNGGGSPGHVFRPVAGILRAIMANAFVSQRLRPLPSRQNRAELLTVTGLIEDGKLTPVVDRTYPPSSSGPMTCCRCMPGAWMAGAARS